MMKPFVADIYVEGIPGSGEVSISIDRRFGSPAVIIPTSEAREFARLLLAQADRADSPKKEKP